MKLDLFHLNTMKSTEHIYRLQNFCNYHYPLVVLKSKQSKVVLVVSKQMMPAQEKWHIVFGSIWNEIRSCQFLAI
jgi:hypothetical protein